jgi:hypothetical protein
MVLTAEMGALGEKPVLVPLCSPQILHGLAWDWTFLPSVRRQQLTTWAISWGWTCLHNVGLVNNCLGLNLCFHSKGLAINCLHQSVVSHHCNLSLLPGICNDKFYQYLFLLFHFVLSGSDMMFVMALQHYHNNVDWANGAVSTAPVLMTTEWLVNDTMKISFSEVSQFFGNYHLMTNHVQIHY